MPSPDEQAIAAIIAAMIVDGACLQMGSEPCRLPAAVCRLRLVDRQTYKTLRSAALAEKLSLAA